MNYAGFWIRLLATLVDVVLLTVIIVIPILAFQLSSSDLSYQIIEIIFGYIMPIVATIYFWKKYKATPGKILLKLHVVDMSTGAELSFIQAIRRYFGYLLSSIPFGLGFLWIVFDKNKQGWHDKIANTVVVKHK